MDKKAYYLGLLPEIDEREAAQFAHYTWMEWGELDYDERVRTVAHHRLHHLISLHQQDAINQEQKRHAEQEQRRAQQQGRR